ncbi:MAG TPA: maleylpyruvate isomerase family mycothiol-dependent enzyme [Acidimicrobiales bacterium]|jgi:uncharacterized protein (TIGR03083 family)|nr:maleylpyruvate isomerase family mycothiol-dependent enzyme [Acidimicrobiales bacterium]
MTLRPDEIKQGYLSEMDAMVELLRGIDETGWATASRCEGWTVADVAAHAVGSSADVAAGRLEGLGSPEVTAREVAERKGKTATELADELASLREPLSNLMSLFDEEAWQSQAPGGYDGTLAQGVEALLYDTWAHSDDIRAALGEPSATGIGLRSAVHHLALTLGQQGWGPATLALDGVEEVAVAAPVDDAPGPGSKSGPGSDGRITGDALTFVLAASGRIDPEPLGLDSTVNVYR